MVDELSDETPSGLITAEVNRRAAILSNEPRVRACKAAAAAGRPAHLGLFVHSHKQNFYQANAPTVPGFEPAAFVHGDWDGRTVLSLTNAGEYPTSNTGFTAACRVDLATVGNVDQFLWKLVSEFGSVSIAPRFSATLDEAVPYIKADPKSFASATLPYNGDGVIVCALDMGCDWSHRNFRHGHNLSESRLVYLGVMDGSGNATPYVKSDIENWIAGTVANPPYKPHDTQYNCVTDSSSGTHGTLVLDIAGGNGVGTGLRGVASAADLMFMQVLVTEDAQGRRFVGAESIYQAALKAIEWLAANRPNAPVVFNVSLGTNEGPHDSLDHNRPSLWNIAFDKLFAGKNGRALVWSAGNAFSRDLHLTGRIEKNKPAKAELRIAPNDKRENSVTFWADVPAALTLAVRVQRQNQTPLVWQGADPAAGGDFVVGAKNAGHIGATLPYGMGGDLLKSVTVTFKPPASRSDDGSVEEDWLIELRGTSATPGGSIPAFNIQFDAWIERDDDDQSVFRPSKSVTDRCDVEARGSLNAGASSVVSAIVVGAVGTATYVPPEDVNGPGIGEILAFSSAGPTRGAADADDRLRPDVCAPGEIIQAARSLGDPGANGVGFGRAATTISSGTSMAAPLVAGLIALLFDKRRRLGLSMPDPKEVRTMLIDAARPNVQGSSVTHLWDPQRGWGCVDALNLLK